MSGRVRGVRGPALASRAELRRVTVGGTDSGAEGSTLVGPEHIPGDARQESNYPAVSAEKPHVVDRGGAESGALSDGSPSPAQCLPVKLAAGLTPDDRAALARLLGNSDRR